MSRSRKKIPIHGVCIVRAGEMGEFKRRSAKRLRAATKEYLTTSEPDALVDPRSPNAVIERWSAPDDGKIYDPGYTKALRK